MRLYIETMDATLVEFSPDGRVRLDNEEWVRPSVQERRAIIHAAQETIDVLQEVVEETALEPGIIVPTADGGFADTPIAVSEEDRSAMMDAARNELEDLKKLLQVLEMVS